MFFYTFKQYGFRGSLIEETYKTLRNTFKKQFIPQSL